LRTLDLGYWKVPGLAYVAARTLFFGFDVM